MENEKFLKECEITQKDTDGAKCTVEELKKIYHDFKKKIPQYEALGEYVMNILQQENKKNLIHSIKFRVKNPSSLIRKIVDKNKEIVDKGQKADRPKIRFENYQDEINDLLWLRILLYDAEDRVKIDEVLNNIRDFCKKKAYIPEGKEKTKYIKVFWQDSVKSKLNPYSSFHYIGESKLRKRSIKFEIQVRSLLDEARSELDHFMRYKNKEEKETDDNLLNGLFELLFQKLDSGNALISLLKGYYVDKNPNWLLDKIKKMRIDAKEKKGIINNIKNYIEKTSIVDFYFNDKFTILEQYKNENFYNKLVEKISENKTFVKKYFYLFVNPDNDKETKSELYKYLNHYQA